MAKKVLVVDDELSVLRLVERGLQREGHEVCTAVNGAECLQRVATESPDLVILDVNMPVMDGFQALRVLRENAGTKHLPVIMLTACGEDQDVARGWMTGADLYVPKPFELDDLLVAVSRILDVTGSRAADSSSADEPAEGPQS